MTITPDVASPDTSDPELPPIPDGAVMVTLKIARFNPEDPDDARAIRASGCRACPATDC